MKAEIKAAAEVTIPNWQEIVAGGIAHRIVDDVGCVQNGGERNRQATKRQP